MSAEIPGSNPQRRTARDVVATTVRRVRDWGRRVGHKILVEDSIATQHLIDGRYLEHITQALTNPGTRANLAKRRLDVAFDSTRHKISEMHSNGVSAIEADRSARRSRPAR